MSVVPTQLEPNHPHARPTFEEQHAGFLRYAWPRWVVIDGPSGRGGHQLTRRGLDGAAYNPATDILEIWESKGISRESRPNIGINDEPTAITVNLRRNLDELIATVAATPDLPNRAVIAFRLRRLRDALDGRGPVPRGVRLVAVSQRAAGVTRGLRRSWQTKGIDLPVEFESVPAATGARPLTAGVPVNPRPARSSRRAPSSQSSAMSPPSQRPPVESRATSNRLTSKPAGLRRQRRSPRGTARRLAASGLADLVQFVAVNGLAAQEALKAKRGFDDAVADMRSYRNDGYWVGLALCMDVPTSVDVTGFDPRPMYFLTWTKEWARTSDAVLARFSGRAPPEIRLPNTRPHARHSVPCRSQHRDYQARELEPVLLPPLVGNPAELGGTYTPETARFDGPVPDGATSRRIVIVALDLSGRQIPRITVTDTAFGRVMPIVSGRFDGPIWEFRTAARAGDRIVSESRMRFVPGKPPRGPAQLLEDYRDLASGRRGIVAWRKRREV